MEVIGASRAARVQSVRGSSRRHASIRVYVEDARQQLEPVECAGYARTARSPHVMRSATDRNDAGISIDRTGIGLVVGATATTDARQTSASAAASPSGRQPRPTRIVSACAATAGCGATAACAARKRNPWPSCACGAAIWRRAASLIRATRAANYEHECARDPRTEGRAFRIHVSRPVPFTAAGGPRLLPLRCSPAATCNRPRALRRSSVRAKNRNHLSTRMRRMLSGCRAPRSYHLAHDARHVCVCDGISCRVCEPRASQRKLKRIARACDV
jgi:hypothetical protein